MAKSRASKKSKRIDERPARKAYWYRRTLEKKKVKALMRNGFTRSEATEYWNKTRKGRVPDGFLR